LNFDKLIAIFDADWDESKHPRAKNGQFGKKGSGGSTSAGSKEKKKPTMSKSYKALSSGQKADAKANVASQIKSMSKEKQISVANRVLKAQGKEPIVANKDGTYTWTNKGERVTTQKPPRIKSDKLARAIVSNGYAVPGIKTGVSATASEPKTSKSESSGGASDKPEYLTKKFDTLERHRLVDYKLDKMGNTYMVNSHAQGVTLPATDIQRTVKYLKAMFEGGAKSFEEAIKGLPTHKDGLLNKRNYTFEKIAKGIASTLHKEGNKGSSNEGGMTKEQLAAAGRQAAKMNGGTSKKSDNSLMTQKFSSVERQELVRKGIANEGNNLIAHSQMTGGNLKPNDVYETVQLLENSLSEGASNFKEALADVKNSSKKGPHYAKIASQIINGINEGDRGHEARSKARHQKYLDLAHSTLKPKDKDKVIKSLGDAQYYLESRYHEEGKKFDSSMAENAAHMLSRALREPDINTVSQAIGLVRMARRDGAKLGNMAAELVKELANL